MKFRIVKYTNGNYKPQFYSEFDESWINVCNDFYKTETEAYRRCEDFMENGEIDRYKYVSRKFDL